MDAIFPVVLTLLSTAVTTYLVPWLAKKNKLAFAQYAAMVAAGALDLVRMKNPDLKAVDYAQQVVEALREKFGTKLSKKAAERIAAEAVARAGIQ